MYPTAVSDVGESYVPGWQNSTRSGADGAIRRAHLGQVPGRSCAPAHEIQNEEEKLSRAWLAGARKEGMMNAECAHNRQSS